LLIEAKVHHLSVSEQVRRLLRQQLNLRRDLAAVTTEQDGLPVFQVLLQEHGEKVSKTLDAAISQIMALTKQLDLLKTMIAVAVQTGLTAQQNSEWEKKVRELMR
jgi:hypothetical protein